MSLCISSIYNLLKSCCFILLWGILVLSSNSLCSQPIEVLADSAIVSSHSQSYFLIDSFYISGNSKTKRDIILRELTHHQGDSISLNELNYFKTRSQQNLINTSLFNFVTITYQCNELTKRVAISIDVKERWYVWPQLLFEVQDRNFNSWWLTKDLFRINYGAALNIENLTGKRDNLSFIVRRGYSEKYGVSYKLPSINKQQTIGISASYSYQRNNEIAYLTLGNQLKFYRNYTKYMRQESEAKVGVMYRPSLYQRHTLEVEYNNSRVDDTIQKLNTDYFSPNKTFVEYFSIQYRYSEDRRDNKQYPLNGWCAEGALIKDGIGVLKHEAIDNLYLIVQVKDYWKLAPRTYFASSLKNRLMFSKSQPYYFNRALGFSDFVRGYEYYVIDGQNYSLIKTAFKYQLIQPRTVEFKRLQKAKKFNAVPYALYLNIHADAAWVQDNYYNYNNPLSNTLLYGYGLGLDFVTYYDYVMRVEFSMNRRYEKGIFFHISAPI